MAYRDKAQAIKYINQYNAKKYDRITVMIQKGQKDVIKCHAEFCGEKVNTFINRAIQETMERDKEVNYNEHAGKLPAD